MSEPDRFPSNPVRDRFSAAHGAQLAARAERERRVVEGLKGGVAMAEIARREGISVRGMRKYVRNLIARRAPEPTAEFIATQLNRLNEALLVSFDAMSGANLPAVDRVVRIVRELDRYHGLGGGAKGTESRRKLLESLVSGAEIESSGVAEDDSSDPFGGHRLDPAPRRPSFARAEARAEPERPATRWKVSIREPERRRSRRPSPRAGQARRGRTTPWTARGERARPPPPSSGRSPFPRADARGQKSADASPAPCGVSETGEEPPQGGGGRAPRDGSGVAHGTGIRRNPLESLDSGAGTAPNPAPLAGDAWSRAAAEAGADLIAELDAVLSGLARQGTRPGGRGTVTRRNLLKSLNSGAGFMGSSGFAATGAPCPQRQASFWTGVGNLGKDGPANAKPDRLPRFPLEGQRPRDPRLPGLGANPLIAFSK